MVGEDVELDSVVLHDRCRVDIAAKSVSGRGLQARAGADLFVWSETLDLTNAEFLGRSVVTTANPDARLAARWITEGRESAQWTDKLDDLSPIQRTRNALWKDSYQLGAKLTQQLNATGRTAVVSLAQANVGDLTISSVKLVDCKFAGSRRLDGLRIDPTCQFRLPPRWQWRKPFSIPFTPRRIIAEEMAWRHQHKHGRPREDFPLPNDGPTALEIASIYRDLRKSLEDSKNEPEANDFYYGEMEMRRLSTRDTRHRRSPSTDDAIERTGLQPYAERVLLNAYWLESGYGLRALRALTTLLVLILIAPVALAAWGFDDVSDPITRIVSIDPDTGRVTYEGPASQGPASFRVRYAAALEFSVRASTSLLRPIGTPPLTGLGTAIEVALRLLGPLLLAFAILALRGRMKR
jgi:hypothetical protein